MNRTRSDLSEHILQVSERTHKSNEKRKRKDQKYIYKEERKIKKLEKELLKDCEEVKYIESKEISPMLGRQYTVSIALPGSILDNAQTPELRTYLAGQIARACVIFKVLEGHQSLLHL